MKKEAEANADADKEEKEKIEKINAADSLIFQTEKQLSEYGDKLSDGNKTAIKAALETLKKAHQAQDLTAINPAIEALNKVWEAASKEMYAATANESAQQPPKTDASAGDTSKGEDVADVDFEEVIEEEKKEK
jgi:molecular chaperone DnaK